MSYSLPPPWCAGRSLQAVCFRRTLQLRRANPWESAMGRSRCRAIRSRRRGIRGAKLADSLPYARALEGVSWYATEVLGGLSRAARVAGAKTYE
jgi:hypothetical protein